MDTTTDKILKGYYHCIDCDSLFEADVKKPSKILCNKCGISPSMAKSGKSLAPHTVKLDKATRKPSIKSKKSKLRFISPIFTVILVIQGIVFFMKQKTPSEPLVNFSDSDTLNKREKAEKEKIRNIRLNDAAIVCNAMMNDFIKSKDTKLVYDSIGLENNIKRYYKTDLTGFIDQPRARIRSMKYIRDTEPFVLGALFERESGEMFEASFIQDKERYKIDWAFYVRYNRGSLEDFVAQSEVLESDFRLYMRVLDIGDQVTLVFYPPKTTENNDFEGFRSFSLRLPPGSDIASEIVAVLNDDDSIDKEFRSITARRDPKGVHRVRVRLGLNVTEGKANSLELVDFIANDWYGIDLQKSAESN
ncbi:hypothetical protein OAI07_00550 [Akkermansiaceae bacterium]|nr:hypothetical protein [Akkermansiaceae bacterium]